MSRATRADHGSGHPGAWWIWSLLVAGAALRTTNVVVLLAVVVVATQVVVARGDPDQPWARIQRYVVSFAVVVGILRLALVAAFAPRLPGTVLLTLPTVDLPGWMAGLTVGGPVTTGALFTGAVESLRLIALLAAFTVPPSLVSPHRTVRALPDGIAELGIVTTVALTVTPSAVAHARRLGETRRLRGRPHRGLRGLQGSITSVLEGAFDHALTLAASMEVRGYGGRRPDQSRRDRRTSVMLLVSSVLVACLGGYVMLDSQGSRVVGAGAMVVGALLVTLALRGASKRSVRTRYRPLAWGGGDWILVGGGAAALAGGLAQAAWSAGALSPATNPPSVPPLPWWSLAGLLVAFGCGALSDGASAPSPVSPHEATA
ncbi:MAG: energy-coupling factor transporter transmembrane component T [Microthrixaceae bacterium]